VQHRADRLVEPVAVGRGAGGERGRVAGRGKGEKEFGSAVQDDGDRIDSTARE
jgi:hypothetical protein